MKDFVHCGEMSLIDEMHAYAVCALVCVNEGLL